MASFRIKSCSLNKPNIKDVNATLNTNSVINNTNNTISILLTPQNILNSLTSPQLIIPSSGTGSYITVNSSTLYLNFNTITYQFSQHIAATMNLTYSDGQDTGSNISNIIQVIGNNISNFGFQLSTNSNPLTNETNSGIYLSCSNVIVGNSNSNITLIINYDIFTL